MSGLHIGKHRDLYYISRSNGSCAALQLKAMASLSRASLSALRLLQGPPMEPGVAQPTSELGQLRLELKALKDEAARWKKDAEQAAEFTEKKTYLDLLKSVNERIAALEARLPRITDAGESRQLSHAVSWFCQGSLLCHPESTCGHLLA